ncbi:hypothetical protein NPIL_398651 [Nephila pilipes]|uniref:Uncharacterized protein n=1 Tax=Nephila pilipes TaxID=299642 RepID=A0A8X6IRS3_NEPPI|nr:hypothetical protein NPIL_398651 [Nephila pilipes]
MRTRGQRLQNVAMCCAYRPNEGASVVQPYATFQRYTRSMRAAATARARPYATKQAVRQHGSLKQRRSNSCHNAVVYVAMTVTRYGYEENAL